MTYDHKDKKRLEEIVQQTRWDEISDARQRIFDRLEAIDRLQFNHGDATKSKVSLLKQRTVQLYVRQVETILDPVDRPTTKWWSSKRICQFELPNGELIAINGLEGYLELGEQIEYTVEVKEKPHSCHVGTVREVPRTTTPPPEIHDQAFSATNRALADQGIEFDTRDRDVGENETGKQNAV